MSSAYPASTDTFITHVDNNDEKIAAAHINKVQDCVVAIENEVDSHKNKTTNAHGGIVADYDGDFLALVEKNYKDIAFSYTYTSGLLTGVSITGDITATISYTYSSGLLYAEVIAVTVPFVKTITAVYTYTNGLLSGEARSVS